VLDLLRTQVLYDQDHTAGILDQIYLKIKNN
jgi:hypothetical protein